ncbi:MAG: hypothetical protein D5S00_06480 [Tindallia sp. MSAO_Bac2]|nr:MAG: hypothetical protein D5S00_06480 [Tindallia sp. MSAO_Bac2]
MERKNRDRLKEKIFDINNNLTEKEAQKILDLMEEEVKKAAKQSVYSLEVQYMLDEWLEEEFPEEYKDNDRTVH